MGDLSYPLAQPLGREGNQSIFGAAGIKMQEVHTADSVDNRLGLITRVSWETMRWHPERWKRAFCSRGNRGLTTITSHLDSASGKTKIHRYPSIGKTVKLSTPGRENLPGRACPLRAPAAPQLPADQRERCEPGGERAIAMRIHDEAFFRVTVVCVLPFAFRVFR